MGTLIVNQYLNKRLWTPAEITTALWLDAADSSTITTVSGAISQWNDKSGNNRNAVQSASSARPLLTSTALNGFDVLTFDGSDDILYIDSSFMATTTLIIACVVKENSLGFGGVITSKIPGRDFSPALNQNSSGYFEFDAGSPSPLVATTKGVDWGVVVGQSLSSSSCLLAVNGTIEDSKTQPISITDTSSQTALGCYRVGGSNFGAFDLGELLVLTSNSTLETRQKIEGYLAHKWGLTANLPATHPYKNNPLYA